MNNYQPRLEEIINELVELELDGEDTQYILEQIGMDVQMAVQLTCTYPGLVQSKLSELEAAGLI